MDVFYVSVLPSEKDATSATRCFLLVTNLESYFFANRQLFVKRQSFSREETYSNIYFITNIRLLRGRKKMKINLFTYHFNTTLLRVELDENFILSIITFVNRICMLIILEKAVLPSNRWYVNYMRLYLYFCNVIVMQCFIYLKKVDIDNRSCFKIYRFKALLTRKERSFNRLYN